MKKGLLVFAVCGCLLAGGPAVLAGEPTVADLIGGLKGGDEAARLKAIDQLAALGAQAAEAVTPLTELLKDSSLQVRIHAVDALGAIGAPAKPAVAAMVELVKDPDATLRREVVKAVTAIRPGPEVMIPLCLKLLEDPDPAVRMRILSAIADAGPKAVPGLIEGLKNDKAAYWACLVLRDIGPAAKEAVPALIERLKDPRPEIRREVVLTLGAMKEAAVPAISQIAATLSDEDARTAATFALGQIGQIPADAEATIKANAKGGDKMLATVSMWALTRVHPEDKELRKQTTEQLINTLKDKDPFVRVAAARALAALPPDPEINIPIWEKAFKDADETTAQHAMDALAALGAPAVPRMIDLLKYEKLRVGVVYILGRIGPDAAAATPELVKLLDDKNDRVVHETLLALANIGPRAKDAVPALTKALGAAADQDTNACAVAYALGKIGPAAAAAQPALLKTLKSTDQHLALMSAWALAQIEPTSAEIAGQTVPVLTAGLTAALPIARQSSADALGALGPLAKDAAAALQKAANDDEKSVRDAAAGALAAIKKPATQPPPPAPQLVRGDTAVTTEDNVEFGMKGNITAKLPKGTELKVLEVRGAWVGVRATIDGKSSTGWVPLKQVAKK